VSLPAAAIGGLNPATLGLTLFGAASNRFLNLELSALEQDGRGHIVSSPRVVTSDQRTAHISQGSKTPYQVNTGNGSTSVQWQEASLKLEVTPQITPDGGVILDVQVNKDSLGEMTTVGREINVKEVNTQVLVENGGTVVIGGIFEQEDTTTTTKVPLLGDIPVAGALFRNKSDDTSRTELLVFLTPRVVTADAPAR